MDKRYNYDAIVIGAGHAGIEAGLALSRMGKRVLIATMNLDSIGYLACNPSIGGVGKSHLVREIDALGGQMALATDSTLTQIRMLNSSKGGAVQSYRAQVDKYKYHHYMKQVLENDTNIVIRQCEIVDICTDDIDGSRTVVGVMTSLGQNYYAPVVLVCAGVYMDSSVIEGHNVVKSGPSGFRRSEGLADALKALGLPLRRFKTGTPARINSRSVDFEAFEIQRGEDDIGSFSDMTFGAVHNTSVCYLGHTCKATHDIIRDNLDQTIKYSSGSDSVGARYCPSIEDKIVRFGGKDSHQFFLESEGYGTNELYVQGISTSLPPDVQDRLYRSIRGLEHVEIMRDAYAIEYECIDSLALYPSLMTKAIRGLFCAGQVNGTSGYEEAAAQGLVAGINAGRYIDDKLPVIMDRLGSYIGVMIDDLVTLGTDEPYRMMTSRSENRLSLRQDNAGLRLTQLGIKLGIVDKVRKYKQGRLVKHLGACEQIANDMLPSSFVSEYFGYIGMEIADCTALSVVALVKREGTSAKTLREFCSKAKDSYNMRTIDILASTPINAMTTFVYDIKYSGYIARLNNEQKEVARLEAMHIDIDDYSLVDSLSTECIERLNKIKPQTIGQASRISGVKAAEINALLIYLKKMHR